MLQSLEMGNFYTNVTLRTAERKEMIEHMRAQGRSCFVSPVFRGFTTVYDRLCDEQNVHDLEALAEDLSSAFHCSALAVLNHDDDVLWIGLTRDGERITTYNSEQILSGSAWKLAQEYRVLGLVPLVWFLMRWPIVLFAIWRHGGLASALGIPNFSVGFGYRYLSRGERPLNANADQFESVH